MTPMKNSHRSGFSLVEVALALMVVGVGMVAVFSVLPVGLEANKRAIDDTQCALFAEEIFSGFRAEASRVAWADVPKIAVPNPVPEMWEDGDGVSPNGQPEVNIYQAKRTEIIDYALRYHLQVNDVPNQRDVKSLRLLVWNGEYGGTANAMVFYTELHRSQL